MRFVWVPFLLVILTIGCGGDPSDRDPGEGTGGLGGSGGGGGTNSAGGTGGGGGESCSIPAIRTLDPDRGPPGYGPVLLRGECLGGDKIEVSFNGSSSIAIEVAPDQTWIKTAVPVGATTGTVRLLIDGLRVDGPVFTVTNENPVPVANSASPERIKVNSPSTQVSLNGSGFVAETILYLDGVVTAPVARSPTSLRIALDQEFLSTQGRHYLEAETPAPGGGRSGAVSFVVYGSYNVLSAEATSPTEVVVTFDIAPDPVLASDASHFMICERETPSVRLAVIESIQDEANPRILRLRTSTQIPGMKYYFSAASGVVSEFGGYLSRGGIEFTGFQPGA